MGSRFSKAVRPPHRDAAASVTASVTPAPCIPSDPESGPRQESPLPDTNDQHERPPPVHDTFDDAATSAPTTMQDDLATPLDDAQGDAMDIDTPNTLSELVGRQLDALPIPPPQSVDSGSTSSSGTLRELPGDVPQTRPPQAHLPRRVEPCLICGVNTCNGKKDTDLRPCSRCHNLFCAICLRQMFIDACTDMSRMPPRCCNQIPLHHAKPYLTQKEISLFKAKYEEWSTPNPFYCPVPTCSAFIPERLLPEKSAARKDKQRVDSGVGTLASVAFTCPSCETDICVTCRDVAHPNATCNPLEFGVDKETAELLKLWGYKRCPKCGNGMKRMFGCNHMECRCGAHFCWVCLKNQETGCNGECEDDYDDEERDSDDEPDREEDFQDGDGEASAEEASTEQSMAPRNLDGGSSRYWEYQDVDFGDEPTDMIQDRSWDCYHDFTRVKVSLADSLKAPPTGMECMKCWAPIQPEVQMPSNINNGGVQIIANSLNGMGLCGGRGRGRGGRAFRGGRDRPAVRAHHQRRRSLFLGSDSTRPNSFGEILVSHSQPNLFPFNNPFSQTTSANGVHVVDTYGNTIHTTETPAFPRRASEDVIMQDSEDNTADRRLGWMTPVAPAFSRALKANIEAVRPSASSPPPGFHNTNTPPFSFAYQCESCDLLLCYPCSSKLENAQDEKRREEDEAEAAKYEAARQEREDATRQAQDDVSTQGTTTAPLWSNYSNGLGI
jgi:hypothetical protein